MAACGGARLGVICSSTGCVGRLGSAPERERVRAYSVSPVLYLSSLHIPQPTSSRAATTTPAPPATGPGIPWCCGFSPRIPTEKAQHRRISPRVRALAARVQGRRAARTGRCTPDGRAVRACERRCGGVVGTGDRRWWAETGNVGFQPATACHKSSGAPTDTHTSDRRAVIACPTPPVPVHTPGSRQLGGRHKTPPPGEAGGGVSFVVEAQNSEPAGRSGVDGSSGSDGPAARPSSATLARPEWFGTTRTV